jgi:hypothetical protein
MSWNCLISKRDPSAGCALLRARPGHVADLVAACLPGLRAIALHLARLRPPGPKRRQAGGGGEGGAGGSDEMPTVDDVFSLIVA